MKTIVRPNIANLKPYVPGKPIEEVQRELGLKKVIKLASNENCLGASPKALAAVSKGMKTINRYPDASCFYLKRKLASFLGVKDGNLIMGNGSDEIIVLAVRTFAGEGDEIVIARPTFLIYEIASQIQNLRINFVPLTDKFKYDLRAMKEAVTPRTRIVFIANPDNPTGTYVTKVELDEFFSSLSDDVLVFLDEAYFEFAKFGRKDYPNGLDYLSRPNTIVARSFSKAYGLAGLRVGYGVSGEVLVNYMERVRDPFNVNLLAQAAAAAALDDKTFIKNTLKHTETAKSFLYKNFDKMGIEYVSSATNFIIFNVKRDCKAVFRELLKKGVIVRDMAAWGLNTYLRVTVGTESENNKFISALKDVIRKS